MQSTQNPFVAYLNSLHSLGANGSNALAESQAVNRFFGELYQPFPITDGIYNLLTDGTPRVIVLTGHAGDGKSTLALDLLKRLRGIPVEEPLAQPLREKETISSPPVTIIKDMSEASAATRHQYLKEAFKGPESCLVVSNTGPLLQSVKAYMDEQTLSSEIESRLLKLLTQSVDPVNLESLALDGFPKKLLILNLTRLDNVEIGAKLLTRLVNHSGWSGCESCSAKSSCAILQNRNAVKESASTVEQRVRWLYQRLNAYEQRLTLRQIVAQLAFALTGGKNCEELAASSLSEEEKGPSVGLQEILFSESFFGCIRGVASSELGRLQAIAMLQRTTFGGPIAVDFEQKVPIQFGLGWATLPQTVRPVWEAWSRKAADSSGVRWRFAIRRMSYMFGTTIDEKEKAANTFLKSFLQSPSLQEFDHWRQAGKLVLSKTERNSLRISCLKVLLEVYSGFSSGQFSKSETLYLTLRRPDQAVVQPTQLVIESLQFRDFEIEFDKNLGSPALTYQGGEPRLPLSLPLLDYIRRRDAGHLGGALAPIHQAQLDVFRAKLLSIRPRKQGAEQSIEVLRAGIEGDVTLHSLQLDTERCILEQD